MKTFWTTFYSYKGGVGRSLALANVAALLVQKGHRVVLLDFDLEAPGLDTFEEFKDAKEKPGIIEYVAEFQRRQIAPEIKPFVHAVKLPDHLRGKLWIMPAGRKDKAYNHLLARTRWAELFNDDGLGAPFIENWKLSIEQEFRPDYVLIDSRTGLTEVGGVCTTAFPDLVVMLFGLNEQNVEGTATVAQHIREADLDRPPRLHFVATPVPNSISDNTGLLKDRLEAAEKTLGIKIRRESEAVPSLENSLSGNTIRYWPPAALTERLFVLDNLFPEPEMVHDHSNLCKRITDFNSNGFDYLYAQSEKAIKADDVELAGKLANALMSEFSHRPEAVFLTSRLARIDNRVGDPVQLAERAFALDPIYQPPFEFLYAHYSRAKQFDHIKTMCEKLLGLDQQITRPRKIHILVLLGQLQMFLHKYQQAAKISEEILGFFTDSPELPPASALVYEFNAAESLRRAGGNVPHSRWKKIIKIFESVPALDSSAMVSANKQEAMYIPYAITGDLVKARDCLRKAQRIAEAANDLEPMFSVRDYTQVSRAEFRLINDDLQAALERGELWDGTKLSAAQGESGL